MVNYTVATIGIDDTFYGYRLTDGEVVNVRIMDTCGQERFDAINNSYYKDADCCLLVYDITSKKSFEKIKYYIKQLKENSKYIKKVILLGNKTDLEEEREISKEEGVQLAQDNGFTFMESSCVDNYNVSDAFTALIEMTNNELIRTGRFSSFRIKGKIKNSKKANGEKNKIEENEHKRKFFC
jgi:small GTP-binding protein